METQNHKEWFLKQKDFHHGPYNDREIESYIQKHRFLYTKNPEKLVSDQVYFWREGFDSWVKLEDYYAYKNEKSINLPKEAKNSNQEQIKLPLAEEEILPPPLPKEEIFFDEVSLNDSVETEVVNQVTNKNSSSQVHKKAKTTLSLAKLIYLAGLILFLKMSYEHLSTSRLVLPQKFNGNIQNRLKSVLNVPLKKMVDMESYFDSSENAFWITTNIDKNANVHMELSSIEGEVVTSEKIILKSTSVLNRHVIKFEQLVFESGKKLYPGYYNLKLEFFIQDDLWWEKIFNVFAKDVVVKEKRVLLGAENGEEFEKMKSDYVTTLKVARNNYLEDLEQKYSTLSALLTQIDESFFAKFETINKGNDIAEFENSYATQAGPMLTKMNSDNHQAIDKVRKVNTELVKEYDELSEATKKIGAITMEMIFQTKEKRFLTTQFKSSLKSNFKGQIGSLQKNFQTKISQIQTLKN